MSYNIVITEASESDFEDSIVWYAKKSPKLSDNFKLNTKQAIEFAADLPFACSAISKKARHVIVHGFPYRVIFLISNNDVVIIAILQHKRSPTVWQKRITNH